MVWPERSAGIASFRPASRASLGHGRAELLVHEHARDGRVGARADGLQQALEDQVLGVGDDRRLLGIGFALDPEEPLLEGAAVVEREDVEGSVVAEVHARQYSREGARRGVGRSLEWGRTMSSGADLFVVCKQCGSEVSPYITECPYCGSRLRRRAPKLPRAGAPQAPSPRGPAWRRCCGRPRGRRAARSAHRRHRAPQRPLGLHAPLRDDHARGAQLRRLGARPRRTGAPT